MRRIDKPWGHELIWAHTKNYIGKLLVINPGHKLSKQYHEIKEETIYVMDGTLVLEVPEGKLILKPGAFYHITPGTVHRFCAPSEGCKLMEISTPHLDDVIRLEDEYGRVQGE